MASEEEENRRLHREHLGDGVYASFDGHHINLAVNHHLNHAVSLDPYVVRALVEYARARGAKV